MSELELNSRGGSLQSLTLNKRFPRHKAEWRPARDFVDLNGTITAPLHSYIVQISLLPYFHKVTILFRNMFWLLVAILMSRTTSAGRKEITVTQTTFKLTGHYILSVAHLRYMKGKWLLQAVIGRDNLNQQYFKIYHLCLRLF